MSDTPAFVCPICRRVSHHPRDLAERFCEVCGFVGDKRRHEWGPSRVGHGEAQCVHCLVTDLEATVLGPFCLSAVDS